MRIGVDAMGGDSPLTKPIAGAVQAANDFGIDIVLYGDESQIRGVLKQHRFNPVKVDVVHCTEVVEMHESPALALPTKPSQTITSAAPLYMALPSTLPTNFRVLCSSSG